MADVDFLPHYVVPLEEVTAAVSWSKALTALWNRSCSEFKLNFAEEFFLKMTHEALVRLSDSPETASSLCRIIGGILAPQPRQTPDKAKLAIGCSSLDQILQGGIWRVGITEISGEAGTGKTHLGLQLLLQVQLPLEQGGLDGRSIYISTESVLPVSRLRDLAQSLQVRVPWLQGRSLDENVLTQTVTNLEAFWNLMSTEIPTAIENNQIRLVVVDSIAALFRLEEFEEGSHRAVLLSLVADQMKRLSQRYLVPFVVINQATDSFAGTGDKVIPALGLTWSQQINTRIFLRKTGRDWTENGGPENGKRQRLTLPIRTAEVVDAGLARDRAEFLVTQAGVASLDS